MILEKNVHTESLMPPNTWDEAHLHFHAVLQSKWYNSVFQMITQITSLSFEFFKQKQLAPVLMPVTCQSVSSPMGLGSDSSPVSIHLFDEKVYLADSMQFQLEYLLRLYNKGTWYIMPTFRGEDHDYRHLNQFFHIESEILGTFTDVMTLVEDYIFSLLMGLISDETTAKCIQDKSGSLDHIYQCISVRCRFPRITVEEAMNLLGNRECYFFPVANGAYALTHLAEKKLLEHFKSPCWVTHHYESAVPFYQKTSIDQRFAECGDLLMGIGECVGCGQRHTEAADVYEALLRHNIDPKEYDWYIQMKTHYPLQTSGFGMGLERFLAFIFKHDDIRDFQLMPRLKGILSIP